MYNITITTSEGKVVGELSFPDSVKEVKLNKYIDFVHAYKKFINWLSDASEEDILSNNYMLDYFKHVMNILKEFTGSDKIKDLQVGDFEAHLLDMFGTESIENIDVIQSTDTLLSIFANIRNLIVNYEPKLYNAGSCVFEYKGETWTIPSVYKDALTSEVKYETKTTGEAIEIMEVIRVWDNTKDQDHDGSIHYTSLLKLIAICARKGGESFPTSDSGIELFVNERIMHFAEIDMQTALDIENWITGWWSDLKKKKDFIFSSTPQKRKEKTTKKTEH